MGKGDALEFNLEPALTMMPNYRAGLDVGGALGFHSGRQQPGASHRGRWAAHLLVRVTTFIFIVLLVTGCIPDLHRTIRSNDIRGRILDANTHAGVVGAKICLTEHPNVSCSSDDKGDFHLKATYNHHVLSWIPEGEWPRREMWRENITIMHTNYMDYGYEDDLTKQPEYIERKNGVWTKPDLEIFLTPKH